MKLVKLKKIAKITSGSTAPKDKEFSIEGYPFIRVSHLDDLISESYTLEMPKITIEIANKRKMKLSEKESIVFAKSGMSCLKNRVLKLKEDSYIVNHLACVKVFSELVNVDYLRYYFVWFKPSKLVIDESYPSIRLSDIGELNIPVPPLETQKKIVEVLDKAQGLIDARKEQIRLMDELIQSVFYEMFGDPVENSMKWPLHFLSELCKVGSSKRIYKNEQTISGIPFLRISDLMNRIEVGAETCDLFISSQKFEELKEKGLVPKVGEILVTSRGTLGECYIVNDDDNFYFQDGMISWLSNISDLILPKYLLYLFKTQGIKRQIDGFQAGSTVAYLSITMLKQLEIMLPPIELQNQFISFIQQVDRLKIHAQKSLDEILGLFDSLIQRYFE